MQHTAWRGSGRQLPPPTPWRGWAGWPPRLYLGRQTVKTHVSSVLRTLGASDRRTQAVIAAYESGLVPLS